MADDSWSLAEAKAKFSEVVERALTRGPQHVTRYGRPAVVVVTEDAWAGATGDDELMGDALIDPTIRGLFSDEEVDELFAREGDLGRPVDL